MVPLVLSGYGTFEKEQEDPDRMKGISHWHACPAHAMHRVLVGQLFYTSSADGEVAQAF